MNAPGPGAPGMSTLNLPRPGETAAAASVSAARRRWLAAAAAIVVAAAVTVALLGGRAGGRGSTISRGPGGWLAARRYLLARGARVTLIAEPLARYVLEEPVRPAPPRRGGPGVLALVFPWPGQPASGLEQALDAHLGRGGDVVLAYSGEGEGAERLLDVWQWGAAGGVPLAPWRWWLFTHREWRLQPAMRPGGRHDARRQAAASTAADAGVRGAEGGEAGGVEAGGRRPVRPVRVWAPRSLPRVGPAATVLFTGPGGQPAVAVYRYHGGRVVVLPADALSNARLGEPGNADLLESLLRNLGQRWAFDEFHHGLVTPRAAATGLGRAADLLLAHLVVLYLLAVLALARRQGPAWSEPATVGGSTATFLLGLGALHHRLGHHAEGARLLLRRARELDRGLLLPSDLDRQAASAGPRELVEIARQVARRRAGDPLIEPGGPR